MSKKPCAHHEEMNEEMDMVAVKMITAFAAVGFTLKYAQPTDHQVLALAACKQPSH